ncbi:major facilitator superfamily domain-containing protein [Yarrowia lipolytica]|uniref:Major facilitator superfamily domain-containing protein n=1 Tax=Yarrowia lipolytica TaxID=4952 RepID=A0A371C0M4_YARLL|nr:major facilitator superfamily domain-containing protein [Yarrowia lipolytica]RDW32278.1 major facilitator superfamily domain-containing protein [Yarrowia lipolytica]RDW39074.1 major facilitator superfamily domain-containing protein [Yarrowia lipolytica]RDW48193.1 major facilitator superfamily domain-containing protein [Yarrowia lipolytica]RDW54984.1 major facilitator superfamily domain-containing protein [Yarrowia lipolytica]
MSSHTNHDVISLSDWSDTKLDKRDHIIAVKEANDLEVVEVIEVGEVSDVSSADYSVITSRSKPNKTWKTLLWDSANKSPGEKHLLIKLDWFLLSSVMLGYFIKTLNQNNINTAYMNGMKEDYGMSGSQLNYLQTVWIVGYIVGQVPSNQILQRTSARYYLGCLELVWMALTFLTLTCTNIKSLYALRFFVGLTESGFFPGVEYLLGSWYNKDELTKRSTLFAVSGIAASMVTGYLQAAVIHGLEHTAITPWKWLFVFDGIISFPVALYTMFVNPNTPETTTSWYFTKEDIAIAKERRAQIGDTGNKEEPFLQVLKRSLKTWHIYFFSLIFLCYNNTCIASTQPSMISWLKSQGYTPTQYNVYPTAVGGVGIGVTLIMAVVSDAFGGLNYPFVAAYFVVQIIGSAMLSYWNISDGAKWFAYFAIGVPTAWGQPMIFSWLNRSLYRDYKKRNLVVSITSDMAYVTLSWVPILTWNAQDMPRYFIGFTYNACLSSLGLVLTVIATYLWKRDLSSKSVADV